MIDLLKIIILVVVIFASACVSIWYAVGSPTYLSAKVSCDAKGQPLNSMAGFESAQIKLFGFNCQK